MTSIKHVVITGSSGLVGAAVTSILEERGVIVTGVDQVVDGLDVAVSDISDVLDAAMPDAVIHAAAHPGGKSLLDPVENVRVNALGSIRVFDWCAKAKVPVIFTSSSAVYGEQPSGPIVETALLYPGTIYAVSKVACEQWLDILGHAYGLHWTVLRLFATYGAGHKPNTYQGIVNVMLTQLLASSKIVVKGSLMRQRDLLFVDDAAQAIVKTLYCSDARGRILNVGTGVAVTIKELIRAICDVIGISLADIEVSEQEGSIGDPLWNVADIGLCTRVLNFKAKYSIYDGLQLLMRERAFSG